MISFSFEPGRIPDSSVTLEALDLSTRSVYYAYLAVHNTI